jgi:predicted GNAT superfamily acetyltransferase
MTLIRDAVAADLPDILAHNRVEQQQTSVLDMARLQWLVGLSDYCRVAVVDGSVAGFLIALREGKPYDSDNYRWFVERLGGFLYVDRVVVAAGYAGLGIGSQLYRDMFAFARAQGLDTITCEYNIEPPNPASRAFHDRFGFSEVGTQWLDGGRKQVSLQTAKT